MSGSAIILLLLPGFIALAATAYAFRKGMWGYAAAGLLVIGAGISTFMAWETDSGWPASISSTLLPVAMLILIATNVRAYMKRKTHT